MGLFWKYKEDSCKEQDVLLAINGNKEAFSRLIIEYEKSMYRTAKAILKNDQDCADAIQEAIIKAYQGICKLNNTQFFKTWLIKIVINESSRLLKSQKKLVPVEEVFKGDLIYGFDGTEMEVRHAVDSLDSDLRILTVLHYFEDLSIKRIAEVLDIPEGTIKSRLSRARTILNKELNLKEEIS